MKRSFKKLINEEIVLVSHEKYDNVIGIGNYKVLFYHNEYDTLILFNRLKNTLEQVTDCNFLDFEELAIDKTYAPDRNNEIAFLKNRYKLETLIKSTEKYINLDNVIDLLKIEQEHTKDSIAKLVKLNLIKSNPYVCNGIVDEKRLKDKIELAECLANHKHS